MADYRGMVFKLLAAQADAIDGLKEITDSLISTHQQVEEMYSNAPEPDIVMLKPGESPRTMPPKWTSPRRR